MAEYQPPNGLQTSTTSSEGHEGGIPYRLYFFGLCSWVGLLFRKFFSGIFQGFIFSPVFELLGIAFRKIFIKKA